MAPSTVQELKDLCKRVKPTIPYLMETRAIRDRVEDMCRRLRFDHMFCVEPTSLFGGLALFWINKMEVEVIESCKN